MDRHQLPVVVIGSGPIGLAAGAHLARAGEPFVVLEAGPTVATSVRAWSHVQVFSPWKYNIDPVARALLEETGWLAPDDEAYPTGGEIVERYLVPLSEHPALRPHIEGNARVVTVARKGFDKLKTAGRDDAAFSVQVVSPDGIEREIAAKAVIDASGSWERPNPLGASGVAALGERQLADRIFYGIPDVLGAHRERYAGKRVLVVGSGHSAFNALNDLVALKHESPATTIVWAIRRQAPGQMFGGGANDQLAARGDLGRAVERLVAGNDIELVMDFKVSRIGYSDDGVIVESNRSVLPPVDEVIAATGFRPDLQMLSELRLDLDPVVESPTALAPLIDPNVHSCGTVRPHGAVELQHPEADFYIAGMKSYGRAPTFLMLTGYEQVRSIVAAIRGDWEAARRVELTLPETGVCTLGAKLEREGGVGCCTTAVGGPALALAEVVSCCGSPEPVGSAAAGRACCG